MPPPPPPQKRTGRVWAIVGTAVAISLAVCISASALLYAVGSRALTSVQNQVTANATLTATAPTPPPLQMGTVTFEDQFTNSSSGWPNDQHCSYVSGGYHVTDNYLCNSRAITLGDMIVAVQASQTHGDIAQPYGIAFGYLAGSVTTYYEFGITSNRYWAVWKCVSGKCQRLVNYTPSTAIRGGLDAQNTLTVRAIGTHFDFYVNSTWVGQASDSSYTDGYVGVVGAHNGETVFHDFVVAKPA